MNEEKQGREKPHIVVQIFLWVYGLMWLNMIFATGLNSLYLGYIDYNTGSIALAMTMGLYFIFKYV